jgi:hypothetical protein
VICSLYTAPPDADPFDIETIKLANPALGTFQNPKEILAMARDAKRMPARERLTGTMYSTKESKHLRHS